MIRLPHAIRQTRFDMVAGTPARPSAGIDKKRLESNIKKSVKTTTEVTPDKIVFEEDEKLKEDLFAEGVGIKAKYIVENRPTQL